MNYRSCLIVQRCSLISWLLLTIAFFSTQAIGGEQTGSWVDRARFPESYSILTSDRVMFPDDISDWPLKIDATHQLFIDDFLMSDVAHLRREFHQPVKHPENPLTGGAYLGVLYESDKGLFRMWIGQPGKSPGLLTSKDGVQWEKAGPATGGGLDLGKCGELRGFIHNPDVPEAEGPYKVVLERRFDGENDEPGGFYLYHSRDGVDWEQRPEGPILERTLNCMLPSTFRPTGAGEPRMFQWTHADHTQACGVGDTSTFRYDATLRRYICDGKFNLYFSPEKAEEMDVVFDHKLRLRLRTFSESEDLIHWSPPRFLMYPDRLDPPDRQIYAHVGFVYESMWVGLIQAMRVQDTGWKQVDLRLSYSRDGRHWLRPRERQPFIPLGDADSWDADYTVACYTAPVRMGDDLYFYYTSSRHPRRDGAEPTGPWPMYLGLARLRVDGFASLNAGNTPGQVTTRPLSFEGRKLFVNADVAEDGWIKAAVLSRDAEPVAGYTLDDAVPLTEDTSAGRMTWTSRKELEPAGDGHVRLVFRSKKTKLYSFWIE